MRFQLIPAAVAAVVPASPSSRTRQSIGKTPNNLAALYKRIGRDANKLKITSGGYTKKTALPRQPLY